MTKQVTQLFAAKNIAVHTTAHVNFTQNFTLNATLNSTLTAFHTLYTNVYRKHRKHRKPEQFESQRVLILGGGASGTDIAVEVAGKASKVFSCYAH